MNDKTTYSTLAFLGAIPFGAAALLLLAGITSLPGLGDVRTVTCVYGFGIAAFLAGSLWAAQLHQPTRIPFNLFLVSNGVFLTVFALLVLAPSRTSLAAQGLALLGLFGVDVKLQRAQVLTATYLRVRRIATLVASASLLVASAVT